MGYEGSVTFDKVFVLDNDNSVTATAENSGGKKIVPTSLTIHTVTFDSNGGSAVAAQNVVGGQQTPEPGKPMKQGYRFAGWYAAQDLSGDAYDFSAAVNSSFTLYAKWESVAAISYVGTDGQSVSTSEYTPLESSYTTLPAGTFYVGANTTVSDRITVNGTVSLILGDGAKLTASKGINVPSGATLNVFCQSGGSGALTANAEANNAAIGANYEQSMSGTVCIYGGVITATGGACAAAIGGCNGGSNGAVYIYGGTVTANGGNYAAAIGGGQFGNGGTISILGGKVTANAGTTNGTGIGADSVNSTAKSATITLSYTTADDFIQATSYCGTVTVESGKILQTNDVTPVDVSDSVGNLSTINGKKLTPKKCTVTFALGYDGGTAPTAQSGLLYGIDKATKPTDPIRTGYTFKEWHLNDAVYDFNTVVTDNITLTAAWTANTYKLHFDGNGATGGSMSDQSFTYDVAQNLTANTFTRTGYKFAGWSDTSADGIV